MNLAKYFLLILFVIFILNPAAFASEDYKIITLPGGEKVKVSRKNKTNGYEYTVKFPDGSFYIYKKAGIVSGYSEGSKDLTNEQAVQAEKAIEIYQEQYYKPENRKERYSGNLIQFLLLAVGLIGTFSPKIMWQLSIGWQLKDSEPGDITLVIYRIAGVVLLFIGLVTYM